MAERKAKAGTECVSCGIGIMQVSGISGSYVKCSHPTCGQLLSRKRICDYGSCRKVVRQSGWTAAGGGWARCNDHLPELVDDDRKAPNYNLDIPRGAPILRRPGAGEAEIKDAIENDGTLTLEVSVNFAVSHAAGVNVCEKTLLELVRTQLEAGLYECDIASWNVIEASND